jgi:hypothetical protein
MNRRAIRYSDAELAWIAARKDWTRRELHVAFVARFKRPNVSQLNLTALCKRRNWMTGRTGRFVQGQVSHNKGKRGECAAGSEKGWFKKGAKPANRVPMWSERSGKDGYIEMKVPLENPYTGAKTRFMHKHRYLWEQVNGPLPAGHCLKSLDGDKLNCAPTNWKAIPRALLPRLNGRFGRDYDSAAPEIKPTILAIAELEHAARVAKEHRKDGDT